MSKPLWPWSLFAALIAAAGLPIYIHAPKFYVDNHGVTLAALGGVLALLRLVDVVQDPLFGWLVDRARARRGMWVAIAALVLAVAMVALFAVPPPIAPLAWFTLTMLALFSSYSFLSIAFYAQGVDRATDLGARGHLRLAGWRETGSLIGVCIAAAAPAVLAVWLNAPFTAFALGFAALALLASLAMRREWTAASVAATPLRDALRPALTDATSRSLLLIGLLNAAPVAVTSTLFLFFVESRLALPGWEGGFLLLFFLSAAASAPVWGLIGARLGEKKSLMLGMTLAILTFLWAFGLGAGQGIAFAVICVASGAALGADLVLLPALFARRLAQIGGEGAGFGLWAFASKLSLALAAAVLLPLLQWVGFTSGGDNAPQVLTTLSLLYAALPCALKVLALLLLARTPLETEQA